MIHRRTVKKPWAASSSVFLRSQYAPCKEQGLKFFGSMPIRNTQIKEFIGKEGSMKIDPHKRIENQNVSHNSPKIQKSPGIEPKEKAGEVKITRQGDRVDISARSKKMADMMSAISQLPEVREKKVQAIKQRVDAGSYTIDPSKVAEKILQELWACSRT